jgi:hypothetical protein
MPTVGFVCVGDSLARSFSKKDNPEEFAGLPLAAFDIFGEEVGETNGREDLSVVVATLSICKFIPSSSLSAVDLA